ncbi:unnamed protein product [Protopolystoma xenopodis]|uniref:Uncharacterized protein n=1 Tax=Protopolystoma xenopodis TaxID=117903 RepID=A0A3S5BAE3_9PLAT|nr:unnamed protein product [Protopolystoma xenopodis]
MYHDGPAGLEVAFDPSQRLQKEPLHVSLRVLTRFGSWTPEVHARLQRSRSVSAAGSGGPGRSGLRGRGALSVAVFLTPPPTAPSGSSNSNSNSNSSHRLTTCGLGGICLLRRAPRTQRYGRMDGRPGDEQSGAKVDFLGPQRTRENRVHTHTHTHTHIDREVMMGDLTCTPLGEKRAGESDSRLNCPAAPASEGGLETHRPCDPATPDVHRHAERHRQHTCGGSV